MNLKSGSHLPKKFCFICFYESPLRETSEKLHKVKIGKHIGISSLTKKPGKSKDSFIALFTTFNRLGCYDDFSIFDPLLE